MSSPSHKEWRLVVPMRKVLPIPWPFPATHYSRFCETFPVALQKVIHFLNHISKKISKPHNLCFKKIWFNIYLFKWSCPHKSKCQPFQFPQVALIWRPLWANHSAFLLWFIALNPLFFWCRCHITDTMYKNQEMNPNKTNK